MENYEVTLRFVVEAPHMAAAQAAMWDKIEALGPGVQYKICNLRPGEKPEKLD